MVVGVQLLTVLARPLGVSVNRTGVWRMGCSGVRVIGHRLIVLSRTTTQNPYTLVQYPLSIVLVRASVIQVVCRLGCWVLEPCT